MNDVNDRPVPPADNHLSRNVRTVKSGQGWALPARHAGIESFGNGQVGHQGRLLRDDREPEAVRLFSVTQGLPPLIATSTVGAEGARRDSHEGGFARAAFPGETLVFAREHRERNAVRCPRAGKGLRDPSIRSIEGW